MNRRIFFAALFIAMLAASAAYSSPVAATPNTDSSSAPQQSMAPPNLVIPLNSLQYEINGSLYAWAELHGYVLATTNLANLENINVTIREFYVGFKVSLTCKNITVDNNGTGSASVTVSAELVIRYNVYYSIGQYYQGWLNRSDIYGPISHNWNARYFVPWGTTNDFATPLPTFSADMVNSTSIDPTPATILITQGNVSEDSIKYDTLRHVRLDFGNWMGNKINRAITDIWSGLSTVATESMGGSFAAQVLALVPPPRLLRSTGYIDLWKANGTMDSQPVSNILIMAGAAIDILIGWDWVRPSVALDFAWLSHSVHANANINLHAKLGLVFTLTVTSNYFRHQQLGSAEINIFDIQVPENATLIWRKIGVIVYYGSPAYDIDVTGGTWRGNSTVDGKTLFFVDYGWDGTPDFATNGTGQPLQLVNDTHTAYVTGTTGTVTLKTKGSSGTWIYFNLDISGYINVTSVKRSDGLTLNPRQYWVYNDTLGNKMLYVVDDPAYSYTVELIGGAGGGLSTGTLLLVGAAAAVIVVAALVVVMRRRSGASGVSVKLV